VRKEEVNGTSLPSPPSVRVIDSWLIWICFHPPVETWVRFCCSSAQKLAILSRDKAKLTLCSIKCYDSVAFLVFLCPTLFLTCSSQSRCLLRHGLYPHGGAITQGLFSQMLFSMSFSQKSP
jgi:hypothetical protein